MNNFDKIPNLIIRKYERDLYQFVAIEGTISLNVWNDYQYKERHYTPFKPPGIPSGIIRLDIGGDMMLDEPLITDGHVKAYQYTLENSKIVQELMLFSVLEKYKHLVESIIHRNEIENETGSGSIAINEFKNLIRLLSVHMMNVEKDGMAYVGYEFGCAWDAEHGLGIMTHRNRICKIGGADTSFLTWVAEEDLETNEGEIIDLA
jgi:hypothetical protein